MSLKEDFKTELQFDIDCQKTNKVFTKIDKFPETDNDICLRVNATAPLYSWNYFDKYPIDEDEVIFDKELDVEFFKIKKDDDSLLIALYGNNKIASLQRLLNIFFNEKDFDYDSDIGFSGFEINNTTFFFQDKEKHCVKIKIENFKVKAYVEK